MHIKNCKDCVHYAPVMTGDIQANYGYCKLHPPRVQFIPIPMPESGTTAMPSRKSRLLTPDNEPQLMTMAPATARPRVDAEGLNSGCGQGEPITH